MPLVFKPFVLITLLALATGACAASTPRFAHAVATPHVPLVLPPVTLIGPDGHDFKLSALAGRWVWLYFGYTNCPDVCPVAMSFLGDEYKRLKHPKAVQALFVSVDPQRDDAKTLMTFAHFHNPTFMGVSGAVPAIDALTHALGASYVIDKPLKPGKSYAVSHTNLIFLLDPQGRQVATYIPGATPGDLAADTDALTP
jgi:protein SCO1/2